MLGYRNILLRFTLIASILGLLAFLPACGGGGGSSGSAASPGEIQFLEASYDVSEDTGTLLVTVTRVGGSDGEVSVDFTALGITALDGTDYTVAPGTLTWPDGDTADRTFTVTIQNDSTDEVDETVTLSLTSTTGGATLGVRNSITLTILDDDLPPQPGSIQFSVASYSVEENALTVTITVTRTGGSDGAVTVDYAAVDGTALDGADYNATSGTLSWIDGDSTDRTFEVEILDDDLDEDDETVALSLSSPTGGASLGAQSTATLILLDIFEQGVLQFGNTSYIVNENAFTLSVRVTRTGGADGAVSVLYASRDTSATAGSDYTAVSGRLSWEHGDASERVIVLPVTGDADSEGDETLKLHLLSPEGGATLGTRNPVSVLIVDDDTPASGAVQFSAISYVDTEDGISITITVTRTGGTAGGADVTLVDTGTGSATEGTDYTAFAPVTLSWGDGEFVDRSVEIPLDDDNDSEGVETIDLELQTPTGAVLGTRSTALVEIVDDDVDAGQVQFTADVYAGYEPGDPVTVTAERVGGTAGEVTVDYATSDGSATAGLDYTAASGTLTWADGDSDPKTFTVALLEDLITEGGEYLSLALTNPGGGVVPGPQSTATLVIVDNEPPGGLLQFRLGTFDVDETGVLATIVVSRTVGSQGAVSVDYSTSAGTATVGQDYLETSGTLSWSDGDVLDKSFTVEVLDDGDTEGVTPETVNLTLANVLGEAALGVPGEAQLWITDDDTASPGTIQFELEEYTVDESLGEAVITVTRTGGFTGVAAVDFKTSNGTANPSDYTPTALVLGWGNGETDPQTVTIQIKTNGRNTRSEGPETVELLLLNATGATLGSPSTALLTIVD